MSLKIGSWTFAVSACLFLSGCASLPKEQMRYEIAYQALHAMDTYQTLNIRKIGHSEGNPILGKHPKDMEVIGYMAAETIGHAVVTHQLVRRDAPLWLQRTWHYLSIGYNGQLVIRNHKRQN